MTETCPRCQGSGKTARIPGLIPHPAPCWTCDGTGRIERRSIASHKCLACGNYHPPGQMCPHMLTWS